MMSVRVECDVAIVGGGPAGLGAAIALRQANVRRVVILEREGEAGGVPRHCGHPPFGMREFGYPMTGTAYARRLVTKARRAGVDIRTSHHVAEIGARGTLHVATPEGFVTVSARRVILATGVREAPRSERLIGGDRPIGVLNTGALQSYVYLEGTRPFRRPVVVGTELVSLSAIWTCVAHGMRPAAVIEARERGTARWPLTIFPRLLGIPVHYRTEIRTIVGSGRVEKVVIASRDAAAQEIVCDGVLLTGRFRPEASLARSGGLEIDPGSRGPVVDQFGRCSDPTYFAAGNLLRPVETAGWCFREGRRIGRYVAEALARETTQSQEFVAIRHDPRIAFTVPQRLALDAPLGKAPALQIRISDSYRGRIVASTDGAERWAGPLRSRPERRILVPLEPLMVASRSGEVRLDLKGG